MIKRGREERGNDTGERRDTAGEEEYRDRGKGTRGGI